MEPFVIEEKSQLSLFKAFYFIATFILIAFTIYRILVIWQFRKEESEKYKYFLDNFQFNAQNPKSSTFSGFSIS